MKDLWCWWCCHPSNIQLISMPIYFDIKTSKYHTIGQFCSFACMRSYNQEQQQSNKQTIFNLITKYMYESTGNVHQFTAPPRQLLRVFGGTLSIDEFRSNTYADSVMIYYPPIVPISYITDYTNKSNYRWIQNVVEKHKDDDDIQQVQSTKVNNVPMKIKNSTQSSKNTIEMVLGIKQKITS